MDDLEKHYERVVDAHIFGSQGRKMSIGEGHSFGSQGRKISIGIILDSGLKTISGAVTERKIAISSSENGAKKSSSRIIISAESNGDGVMTPSTKKNTPFFEDRSSPWISVKSHNNTPMYSPKQDPLFTSPVCRLNELNKVNTSSITHMLPEIVLSTIGNERTLSSRDSQGSLEKTRVVDKCSPVEASVSEEIPRKSINSETLKMKLWEALGTDYPTNKKLSNSQHIHEINPGSQLPPLRRDPQGSKEKQNSDSIETDSEGLTVTTKRPNTRSFAKKRATKKQPRKNQKNRRSNERACEKKTNSDFQEKNDLSQSMVRNGFLASSIWNNGRKNGVKLGTIGIFENDNPQESENINDKAHAKKETLSNPKGGYASLPFTNNKYESTTTNQNGEKYSNKPPLTTVHCDSPFILDNKMEPSGELETKGSALEESHIEGNTPTLKSKSLVFSSTKGERRKGMESDKICCDDMNHSSEPQHEVDEGRNHLPVDKTSPTYQNGDRHSPNLQMGNNKQEFIHRNLHEGESPGQSPVVRRDDVDNLFISEKVDSKEESGNSELRKGQDDTQSPTFEFKVSSKHRYSSSNSFPITNHKERGRSSPVTTRKFGAGFDVFKNDGLHGSSLIKPAFDTRETCTHEESSESSMEALHYESSEDGLLPNDIYKDAPISHVKKTDRSRKMPVYTSEDRDSESSNGGSPLSDRYKDEYAAKVPKFMFPPARKRPYRLKGTLLSGSPSPQPTGSQETDDDNIQTPSSEQNEDDEMARAVALFVLALEKIQKKTKLVAKKKSAEIIMSVSEAVQSKFKNIHSQIQTDVQKLTTLTQAKRKRLEAKFEEHQESMKRLHEKFKDEVGQNLKDCMLSLQGLEAHQIELKGATENQKASHMKILAETEEAMNRQIQDAQGRISTINKVGREKMAQLKYVITECLKEDLLR